MRGKTVFTKQEYEIIVQLIHDKEFADTNRQKKIRQKIRNIGFYFEDFYSRGSKYNVEAFTSLFQSEELKLEDSKAQQTTIASVSGKLDEKGQKVKNDKTEITDNLKKGLEPWVDENSEVLILGSLPGDESIKKQSYYCNSSNQFWKIMAKIFTGKDDIIGDKKEFILNHRIALWDCLKSAEREGSSDSNIEKEVKNDLSSFLKNYPRIKTIIINGKGVNDNYFEIYFPEIIKDRGYHIHVVRSTSATAAISLTDRIPEWKKVLSEIIS